MLRPRLRTRHLLLAGAIALTTAPASAQAASCSATDGATLTSALANASCDSIILAAGTYTSSSGFTAPARAVTITGPGATLATITRTGAGDVLTVPAGATLGLSGVTMGGATSGAGLKVTGTGIASLTSDVISGNTSPASGAGIAFSGQTLTVANSRISGNASSADGGGVENSSALGTATFHEVLFTQNTSTGSGGGGAIDTSGVAAVTNLKNATLTNNHANVDGGAVRSGQAGASTTLNNVTIAGNVANDDNSGGGDGGGMSNSAGSITIANSIVANNSALGGGAPDCDSAVASPVTRSGYELIRNATGCTFGGGGDSTTGYLTAVDPLLGGLASNGGTTQTMALSPGSPVVNAGNPAAPTGSGGSCEVTDQRNQVRGAAVQPCDMGAFEVQRMSCTSFSMTIGVGQVTPVLLSCSGDPFVYSIATGPSHGALSGLNTTTGAVTYTPAAGFSGTDSFTYRGVNGPIGSSPATVMFSVTGPAPSGPTPPTTRPGFNLKDAIRKCKRRVPKGPKRTKCIKKAKKRARNQ